MEILISPWRMSYVSSVSSGRPRECIFCSKPRENRDRENYIVYRGATCFIMLNAYPYNTGHLLIAPYAHKPSLTDLSDEELLDLMKCTALSLRALKEALRPDGFNIGLNLGKVAGAGIEDHVHVHVVPRWVGDTNFMPIVAKTKVLPEMLEDTYNRLKEAFNKASSSWR